MFSPSELVLCCLRQDIEQEGYKFEFSSSEPLVAALPVSHPGLSRIRGWDDILRLYSSNLACYWQEMVIPYLSLSSAFPSNYFCFCDPVVLISLSLYRELGLN